jgi:hypothetical protein
MITGAKQVSIYGVRMQMMDVSTMDSKEFVMKLVGRTGDGREDAITLLIRKQSHQSLVALQRWIDENTLSLHDVTQNLVTRGVHPRIFMSLKKGLSVTPTLSQVWQGIFY